MKDVSELNELEKALEAKISEELEQLALQFSHDVNAKLIRKYKTKTTVYHIRGNNGQAIICDGLGAVSGVLVRMLREAHGNAMLKHKSKELIKKLDL